jgi:pSer/pThr/pTyr-binding forkhead associated (FHA) protein
VAVQYGFCAACRAPRTSLEQGFCPRCGSPLPALGQPAAAARTGVNGGLLAVGGAVAAAATGLWLEWESDGGRQRAPLNGPLQIGRDPSADVRLSDPTVSRQHAVVTVVAGQILVDASSSNNGIKLDGGRANRVTLVPGQAFAIGGTTFRIVQGPIDPDSARERATQRVPAQLGMAPARAGINAGLVALGGLLIAAIVGVVIFVAISGKPSGSNPSSSDGVTFRQSPFSCSQLGAVDQTVRLPSSLDGTEMIYYEADGQRIPNENGHGFVRADGYVKQTDGTWLGSHADGASELCTGPSGDFISGDHTMQIVDSNGEVLASGSYSVTP